MSKVLLILVFMGVVSHLEAIDSELCKIPPPERHCIIESTVAWRWPHTERYTYNWSGKNCFVIRWSHAKPCPPVPDPPTTNNFPSEKSCMDECGGWA